MNGVLSIMGVANILSPFNSDGRIRGSFVYMMLCQDDNGPAYIKIGHSDSPLRRFLNLRQGCGVTPRVFSFVNLRTRKAACNLERALLKGFAHWKTRGEWIKVAISEKSEFNKIWQEIFELHAEKGRPLRWNQLSAKVLVQQAEERLRRYQREYMQHGQPYQDFTLDSH